MILPATRVEMPFSWRQLAFGIDWVGILLSSVPLGCLSYVFGWVIFRPNIPLFLKANQELVQ